MHQKHVAEREQHEELGAVFGQTPVACFHMAELKLRTGAACTQLALAGEARCLLHGGPDAARRFRERQKAGLETGSVSADEWARAEAKRARNAHTAAWRKDPRLPGATIDLGEDEPAFAAPTALVGVDVDALYPATADWLRWRWRRHQKDRRDDARWLEAVRRKLPWQREAAEVAVAWASLGITDRRTLVARAVRAAMRAGDTGRAKAIVDAMRAKADAAVFPDVDEVGVSPAGPLTALPVRPWTGSPGADGWKRQLPNRPKAGKVPAGPPKPLGRPRRKPDSANELAALGSVLRADGPHVRAMYDLIPRQEDQLRFLRDLAAYANAPGDVGALHRWMGWLRTLG